MPQPQRFEVSAVYPTPILVRAVDLILRRGFSDTPVSTHRILEPLQRAFDPVYLGNSSRAAGAGRFSDSPVIEMQMRLVESALVLRCYVLGLVFCDNFIGPVALPGYGAGGGTRLLKGSHAN